MRVVSWNLGAAFGPYKQWHDRAWHWLAAVDADLALLQECIPPDWARELWTIQTLPFQFWASALVAKPELQLRPLELERHSLLRRFGSYLATGQMADEDGQPMLVASVHTRAAEAPDWVTAGHDRTALARASVGEPWSNDIAFAGYQELLEMRGQDQPFLIGGDWNTARYLDQDDVPAADGAEFFARAESAGWRDITLDAGGREGRSWYGAGTPRPWQPDHVFADERTAGGLRSFGIEAYPVETLGLSDHAPLVVELDVQRQGRPGEGTDGGRSRRLVSVHARP